MAGYTVEIQFSREIRQKQANSELLSTKTTEKKNR
jgi:hypothetical protein